MWETCHEGVYVLLLDFLTGRISIGELALCEDMCYIRKYLIKRHVVLEDMSHRRTCLAVGHVIHEDMSYRKTCLSGKHILHKDIF